MPEIRLIYPVKQETKLLRVAAYCRVSSDSADQLHSFATQVKYYTEHIGKNPEWELVDIYADEGLTGMKMDKREEFNRLITDCKKGKIDRVITKSVSRFARNTYDCLEVIRILKGLGISVYFEKEDLDSADLTNEMTLTLHGLMAQEESMSISGNMRWSYRKRMEKGEFNCCRPAFGYNLANGTLEINEPEAEIVRRIYDLYLSGVGKQAIANMLNDQSVDRRYGMNKWHISTVHYILNNERYIGDALLQKKYTTDAIPFCQVRNKGEKQQYYVENSHPPIISKEKFEAVKQLQQNKNQDCCSKSSYPLTKKLICPDCGHYYRRHLVRGKAYWTCSYNTAQRNNCANLHIRETDIHYAFTRMVIKLAQYRKYILTPLLEQIELMQMKSNGTEKRVYLIDKQIADLNAQNLIIARLHSKRILDSAEYLAQSNDVNQKVSKLRSDRRKLLQEDENDEMLNNLRTLDDKIAEINGIQTEFHEELLQEIVDRIYIVSSSEICFQLIGGLEIREEIPQTGRCK